MAEQEKWGLSREEIEERIQKTAKAASNDAAFLSKASPQGEGVTRSATDEVRFSCHLLHLALQ